MANEGNITSSLFEPKVRPVAGDVAASVFNNTMPAVTSLRFFAAMAVVFFHFGSTAAGKIGAPLWVSTVMSNGKLGVSFFFILSGFILCAVYGSRLSSPGGMVKYGVARLARVYPVYVLALLVCLPVIPPHSLSESALALSLLHAWGPATSSLGFSWNAPGWTLSVELAFYLSFILISKSINKFPPFAVFLMTGVLAAMITSFNLAIFEPAMRSTSPLASLPLPLLRLPEFAFGCSLAESMRRWRSLRLTVWTDVLFLASIASLALLLALSHDAGRWAPLLFGAIIVLSAISIGPVSKILSIRPLPFLGGASYAIYLLQGAVNGYFDWMFGGLFIGRLIMPIFLVIFACLAFHFLEEPSRMFIKKNLGTLLDIKSSSRKIERR